MKTKDTATAAVEALNRLSNTPSPTIAFALDLSKATFETLIRTSETNDASLDVIEKMVRDSEETKDKLIQTLTRKLEEQEHRLAENDKFERKLFGRYMRCVHRLRDIKTEAAADAVTYDVDVITSCDKDDLQELIDAAAVGYEHIVDLCNVNFNPNVSQQKQPDAADIAFEALLKTMEDDWHGASEKYHEIQEGDVVKEETEQEQETKEESIPE